MQQPQPQPQPHQRPPYPQPDDTMVNLSTILTEIELQQLMQNNHKSNTTKNETQLHSTSSNSRSRCQDMYYTPNALYHHPSRLPVMRADNSTGTTIGRPVAQQQHPPPEDMNLQIPSNLVVPPIHDSPPGAARAPELKSLTPPGSAGTVVVVVKEKEKVSKSRKIQPASNRSSTSLGVDYDQIYSKTVDPQLRERLRHWHHLNKKEHPTSQAALHKTETNNNNNMNHKQLKSVEPLFNSSYFIQAEMQQMASAQLRPPQAAGRRVELDARQRAAKEILTVPFHVQQYQKLTVVNPLQPEQQQDERPVKAVQARAKKSLGSEWYKSITETRRPRLDDFPFDLVAPPWWNPSSAALPPLDYLHSLIAPQ